MRCQYTAIDDATRILALKIYDRHTQANAVDFIATVIAKFPFRIREVRNDNGHEFQAKLHWHVEDQGIRHVYIKSASPQLNGKVERSHRTDQQEFYQRLSYKGDINLKAKPFRALQRRERRMMRFKSARQCQRFVSPHGQIANLFHLHRKHPTATDHRKRRVHASTTWREIASSIEA